MNRLIDRENMMRIRINEHLGKLCQTQNIDYYTDLSIKDLVELKNLLSDINNVLTLKLTKKAIEWISKTYKLTSTQKKELLEKLNQTNANTNGFDIHIESPIKLLAEVKCINPINQGEKFGPAQLNGILDDAIKLKEGKKTKLPNGKTALLKTDDYVKIIFLLDLGDRTQNAASELAVSKPTRSEDLKQIKRSKIRECLEVFDKNTRADRLTTESIYLCTLKI